MESFENNKITAGFDPEGPRQEKKSGPLAKYSLLYNMQWSGGRGR